MAFTFAGQFGPEPVFDTLGRHLPQASVSVYQNGVLATLYTDRTKTTTTPNPTVSGVDGTVTFWAAPGLYQVVPAGGLPLQGQVLPDAADALTDGTTAIAATAGVNGAVPAQVAGYLVINIGGTNFKVPYFNN